MTQSEYNDLLEGVMKKDFNMPYVVKRMREHNYMGPSAAAHVRHAMDRAKDVEVQQTFKSKEEFVRMKETVTHLEKEIEYLV